MGEGQSGGVSFGSNVSVGGDVTGRDKIVGVGSHIAIDTAFRPLEQVLQTAPAETQVAAQANVAALKQEAAKGKDADDGVIAKLVDGLVALVPAAASTVVSMFATPILGGLVGPVTRFVLDKLLHKPA